MWTNLLTPVFIHPFSNLTSNTMVDHTLLLTCRDILAFPDLDFNRIFSWKSLSKIGFPTVILGVVGKTGNLARIQWHAKSNSRCIESRLHQRFCRHSHRITQWIYLSCCPECIHKPPLGCLSRGLWISSYNEPRKTCLPKLRLFWWPNRRAGIAQAEQNNIRVSGNFFKFFWVGR